METENSFFYSCHFKLLLVSGLEKETWMSDELWFDKGVRKSLSCNPMTLANRLAMGIRIVDMNLIFFSYASELIFVNYRMKHSCAL